MKHSILLTLSGILLSFNAMANDTIRIYSNGCDDYQTFIGSHGGQLTMTANSDQWSHFVRWQDGNTDNPRTITTNGNADYTAEFAKYIFSITKNAEHGTISGNSSAEYLDFVTLTVTPDYGYHFTQWSDGLKDNPRIAQITQDTTFTAEFAKNVYSITKNAKHGSISGNSSAEYLDFVTLTVNADYGYHFAQWSDGLKDNPRIAQITKDTTFTATFKSIGDHNITVRLDPSSCSSWTKVRLWAWTDEGNIFDSWPGQIVSKDSEGWYSYTFEEDITSVNIIWNNGTNQTVDIEGVTFSTCYALNSTSGKAITVSIVDCVIGQPLGHADETTTTAVTATPNEDNSVTLTWPAVNGADTYTIEIKKNGVSVCTLVFNANGQLISINFAAPARDGKGRDVPAAEQSASGWTYVVTGLEENASYTYSVTAKDVNGNVLLKQSVDFSTGEEQGIEDVQSDQVQCTKVIRNGQIFILRGDKTYTLTGQETIMP